MPWNVVVIHAALLPTGEILYFGEMRRQSCRLPSGSFWNGGRYEK